MQEQRGKVCYSAYGEDLLVVSWLNYFHASLPSVRYLDIGAGDPIESSNTFLLYNYGARGVLVEPDPDQASALQTARPGDTVINAGIACDERRAAHLFRLTNRLFNTISEERAHHVVEASRQWLPEQRQHIVDKIEIPLLPVNDVIREQCRSGRISSRSMWRASILRCCDPSI